MTRINYDKIGPESFRLNEVKRLHYAEKLAEKFHRRLNRLKEDMEKSGFHSMADKIVLVAAAARYDIPCIKLPVSS